MDETEQNTSNEILATSRSPNNVTAESSTDSCYDYNSCQNGYKFELYYEEIKDRVATIECGLVQVTLRKCMYSLGFEQVDQITKGDLSEESAGISGITGGDESYSIDYATRPELIEALSQIERHDGIPRRGASRFVGAVSGTYASSSIERIMGTNNPSHISARFRCEQDEPWMAVRFDPNLSSTDSNSGQETNTQQRSDSSIETGEDEAEKHTSADPSKKL